MARAAWLARGLTLPSRGSAQDQVLRELYRRELNEKMSKTALFARILGAGLHLEPTQVDQMLEEYRLELTQNRYRPSTTAAKRKARIKAQRKQKTDERLLERVDAMTVPDEELPPLPKPKNRSRATIF